jgi:hypothetical protein
MMNDRNGRIGRRRGAVVSMRLVTYSVAAGAVIILTMALLCVGLRKPVSTLDKPAIAHLPPPAADDVRPWKGWVTDMQSAASAADDGKDILVEFTSAQDGVAPLDTLLQGPAFGPLRRRYVLVRLDVATSQSDPQTVEKTAEWIDRLGLTDLPCLVLFDSAFRPFGIVKGGDATSMDVLLARLGALDDAKLGRDSDLSAAAKASGAERAKALGKALDDVGPVAALGYPEVMQQIVQLDSDGAAGLKARYAAQVSEQLVDDRIQHVVYPLVDAGDLRGALDQARQLEQGVATTVPQRQLLQAFQAQLYVSLGDKQKAMTMMDGAIALDPSTDAATRVRDARARLQQQ